MAVSLEINPICPDVSDSLILVLSYQDDLIVLRENILFFWHCFSTVVVLSPGSNSMNFVPSRFPWLREGIVHCHFPERLESSWFPHTFPKIMFAKGATIGLTGADAAWEQEKLETNVSTGSTTKVLDAKPAAVSDQNDPSIGGATSDPV